MLRFLLGLFIILHGLVHLWYFTLSLGLVQVTPGMAEIGWTGKSWLFTGLVGNSNTRLLASIFFALAALALVISGVGFIARADWWWEGMLASSIFSAAVILSLWDGSTRLIVEKGVIGFLISLATLVALLLFKQAVFAL